MNDGHEPAPVRCTHLADDILPTPIDVGQGAPVIVLTGYALRPHTYSGTARQLAGQARVVVPDLFALRGPWSYPRVLETFMRTLDDLGLDRVTLIGHSFGGAIQLGFAARHPERIVELVFADTLAVAEEWALAREALSHPTKLVRMATPTAALDFFTLWSTRPRQLAGAAWWGFRSGRSREISTIARSGLPTHVLWANRDSLLARDDGERFARELGATFTVVDAAGDVDHDWMYRHPELFAAELKKLDLIALG